MKASEAIRELEQIINEGYDRKLMLQVLVGPGKWQWVDVIAFGAVHGPKKTGVVVEVHHSMPDFTRK